MKDSKSFVIGVIAVLALAGCAEQKKVQQTQAPSTSSVFSVGGFVPAGPEGSKIDLGQEPGSIAAAQLPPKPVAVGVEEAIFCTQIKDRIPQGVATSFDKSVKKVFFFTRVTKAKKPTAVTHVWYWKEKKMAEVPLDVRSENWRTWSSKKIDPSWTGTWAVKVLDENGEVVLTKNFEVL